LPDLSGKVFEGFWHIVERQLGHLEKVHPDYASGVRQALDANGARIAAE
jgi:catalase